MDNYENYTTINGGTCNVYTGNLYVYDRYRPNFNWSDYITTTTTTSSVFEDLDDLDDLWWEWKWKGASVKFVTKKEKEEKELEIKTSQLEF